MRSVSMAITKANADAVIAPSNTAAMRLLLRERRTTCGPPGSRSFILMPRQIGCGCQEHRCSRVGMFRAGSYDARADWEMIPVHTGDDGSISVTAAFRS